MSCSLLHVIHTDSTQYKQLQNYILSITSDLANVWVYICVLFKSTIPVPLKFMLILLLVFKSSLSWNDWRNIVRNVTRIVVWTQKEWTAFWRGQKTTKSDNSRRSLVNECINIKIIKTRKDYRENWKFSILKEDFFHSLLDMLLLII